MNTTNSENGDDWFGPTFRNVQAIYVLYIASFFVGLTGIIGIVVAYMNRGKAAPVLQTHYTYQIRTFWIGLLYGIICSLLMIVGIGFLLFLVLGVWVIVRCVKGLQAASNGDGISNPETWLW